MAPFRTGAKNDLNDTVAICTAVIRPSTRFVRFKSADQQAILLLHRARDHWVHERTALLNQIRAMLAEFGIIAPKGRHALQTAIPEALEDGDNPLPDLARAIISDCFGHLLNLNQRIADQEQCFDMLVSRSRQAKKIMKVAGIGPIQRPPSSPVSAKVSNSIKDGISPPGSGWFPASIQPVVSQGSGELPKKATDICGHSWFMMRVL